MRPDVGPGEGGGNEGALDIRGIARGVLCTLQGRC